MKAHYCNYMVFEIVDIHGANIHVTSCQQRTPLWKRITNSKHEYFETDYFEQGQGKKLAKIQYIKQFCKIYVHIQTLNS